MSASVAPECNQVKDRYDSCFLKWYSESESLHGISLGIVYLKSITEYLKGIATHDECEPLLKQYKTCLDVRLV